ncbi:MAG: type II toxin-antitoxin system RelE/ParE family toxin [candidate division NC10 bacterium]|nr:type II toxin-antitoxin system RelE/ParE family toxin [candidate division NC10 bacterium]
MAYAVVLRPAAERERRNLSPDLRPHINRAILGLENDPRPSGAVKPTGHQRRWRLRVGDYRILYEVDDTSRQVLITRIAHRREVYR